jgi:alkaline phosphatase
MAVHQEDASLYSRPSILHRNDPAAHLHEINAYQDTIKVVKDFVDANPGTVVISTSDHETGGFTLGRQTTPEYPEYKW